MGDLLLYCVSYRAREGSEPAITKALNAADHGVLELGRMDISRSKETTLYRGRGQAGESLYDCRTMEYSITDQICPWNCRTFLLDLPIIALWSFGLA
jgi:hypothetical protein